MGDASNITGTLFYLDRVLDEAERDALNRMVRQYIDGKATFETLYGEIAGIAQLRKTRSKIRSESKSVIHSVESAHG
jgi:hypothetical protein